MSETTTVGLPTGGNGTAGGAPPAPPGSPPNRRDLYRVGSWALAGLIKLAILVPGVAYLLTPLLRSKGAGGTFTPLARFGDLKEGVPQAFPVVQARRDAWVTYPPEPVGTVWLVRQPAGAKAPVLALSAECPHLACAINLSPDRTAFFCPCHTSSFKFDGSRVNQVSPRGMDPLEVEPFDASDPNAMVRVKFERFRTMTPERIPLA
jgi:Rieske Fe-S protein